MTHKIMAICDTEEGYAFRMAEYLLDKVRLPYTLHLFTAGGRKLKYSLLQRAHGGCSKRSMSENR